VKWKRRGVVWSEAGNKRKRSRSRQSYASLSLSLASVSLRLAGELKLKLSKAAPRLAFACLGPWLLSLAVPFVLSL
jgi:hypothetical protein